MARARNTDRERLTDAVAAAIRNVTGNGVEEGGGESASIRPGCPSRARRAARGFWVNHGLALSLYLLLSVALSWPLAQHFATKSIGSGADVWHNLWLLYHVKEAALLRDDLFFTSDLYYPHGISLLLHGLGPVTGVFAFPFWFWGPIAAHNGAVLISLMLSGYCMYLLARAVGFDRGVAFFTGVVLQVMPEHLAGLYGHMTKIFVGLLPIVLLVTVRALDVSRIWGWTTLVGLTLLGTALHSGYHVVYAALGVAIFSLWRLIATQAHDRKVVFFRVILASASTAILVGPLVLASMQVANQPVFRDAVRVNTQSSLYAPDLVQFFIPSVFHRMYPFFQDRGWVFEGSSTWVGPATDLSVTIPWTVLILCLVAVVNRLRQARIWLVFAAICCVLALGPYLRLLGQTHFTNFQIPIILPYAFLTSLPGLEFMRVPGRFMMMSAVPLGICAAFGLAHLIRGRPRWSFSVITVVTALLLLESWPKTWPLSPMPETPTFYQVIATENERYGVLDLPVAYGDVALPGGWHDLAARYQVYQMSHRKPIAFGYLSRTYSRHPLPLVARFIDSQGSPSFLLVDGESQPLVRDGQIALAQAGYRYVVWHKTLMEELGGTGPDTVSRKFIRQAFGAGAQPVVEDDRVSVYEIDATATPTHLGATLGKGWYSPDGPSASRWAASPATLAFEVPHAQSVVLEFTTVHLHDAQAANGLGSNGVLTVAAGSWTANVPVQVGELTTVTVPLEAGSQTVTLTLEAGNFRPVDVGGSDARLLSFAVSSINVITKRK